MKLTDEGNYTLPVHREKNKFLGGCPQAGFFAT